MKYYIDDDDRAFVEKEDGIYQMYADGKTVKTDKLSPDPMKWLECSEQEAKESAILYESYFNK
jgi:hypothetical protein